MRDRRTGRRSFLLAVTGISALFACSVGVLRTVTGSAPDDPPASALTARALPSRRAAPSLPAHAQHQAGLPAAAGGDAVSVTAPQPPDDSSATPARAPGAHTDTPAALKIAYRLDPRLTRGMHLGTRWVSPPRYVTSQSGAVFTLRARAEGSGAGAPGPAWLPGAPDMVAVSPDQGSEVEITVLRAGESDLRISAGDSVKTLKVRAQRQDGSWRVEVLQ